MDEKVKKYIDKQTSLQKEIIQKVRKIFFKAIKNCEESFGWGVIALDNNRFYLVGLKEWVHVGFAINGLTKAEIAEFEGSGKNMRHIKIKELKDIDEKRLLRLIKMVHKKSICVEEKK
jgi:hypothetical protein